MILQRYDLFTVVCYERISFDCNFTLSIIFLQHPEVIGRLDECIARMGLDETQRISASVQVTKIRTHYVFWEQTNVQWLALGAGLLYTYELAMH